MFLPGLLSDAHLWARQAEALSDIATTSIADLTQDSRISKMAERALADAPSRFALAAVSMGGYVAFEMLRLAPERITALALFDTTAAPDSPDRAARRRKGLEQMQHGRFAGVTNKLLPELIHPNLVNGPVGAEVKAMAERVGPEVYLRQQQAILDRPDYRPLLPTLRLPTLVAVGAEDVLIPPAQSLDIHLGIRSSEFTVIRDCGHLPPLEHPRHTTQLLRNFLTTVERYRIKVA